MCDATAPATCELADADNKAANQVASESNNSTRQQQSLKDFRTSDLKEIRVFVCHSAFSITAHPRHFPQISTSAPPLLPIRCTVEDPPPTSLHFPLLVLPPALPCCSTRTPASVRCSPAFRHVECGASSLRRSAGMPSHSVAVRPTTGLLESSQEGSTGRSTAGSSQRQHTAQHTIPHIPALPIPSESQPTARSAAADAAHSSTLTAPSSYRISVL